MQSEECARLRREFINDVVNLLYESGRHDRSKKWIWQHFLRPYIGLEYQTFLKETNPELLPLDDARLVRMIAKFELLLERAKQQLEKRHSQHLLPHARELDEILKELGEAEL